MYWLGVSCAAGCFDQGSGFQSEDAIIEKTICHPSPFSMIDSRASGTALLENLNPSPIARKQLSRPLPDQERSDDQNRPGEFPLCASRPDNQHSQRRNDAQAQLHISTSSLRAPDPQRPRPKCSKLRRAESRKREGSLTRTRLAASVWPNPPRSGP